MLRPTPLVTFASQSEVRDYLKQNDMGTVSEGNRLLKGQEVVIAVGPIQMALPQKDDEPLVAPTAHEARLRLEGRPGCSKAGRCS